MTASSTHPRLVLVALLTLVLAACGGGGGGGGGGGADGPVGFHVTLLDPPNGSYGVARDAEIRATFSDPVYLGSIDGERFVVSLRSTGERVDGTVHLENGNQTAVFVPASEYLFNTRYEVRIFAQVMNIARETLGDDHVAHFTTVVNENPPPPPPPPPEYGAFRTLDPMNVGRSSHRATLLADGRVLVTGGFYDSTTLTNTVEIFDPVDETFAESTSLLGLARAYHTATRLSDGRVLVTGGIGGPGMGETDTAEMYSPTGDRFTSAGTMTKPRAFHTATLLGNGRVLIAGGSVPTPSGTYSSKTAEIYDPAAGTFTALPDMAVYRAAHTATLLPDGRVLLAGGNGTSTTAELFDPQTSTFTTIDSPMEMPRRGHAAVRLPNGDVLLMGGEDLSARTAETYEALNNSFRVAPTYPVKHRKDHTGSVTVDGWVLFTGGSWREGSNLFFNQTTEQYRADTGTFLSRSPLLDTARTRHRATTLVDGRILITGGANIDWTRPDLASAEVFEKDPEE